MAKGTPEARVQTLLPQTLRGNVRYAAGVRAGRWIFATAHNGLFDYASGGPSDIVRAHLPHWDTSKLRREADQIFRNLDAVMRAGGGDLACAVRLDQNYTSGRAVEAYHDARRATMKDHIAPSTSTLVAGFLRPRQEIEVHMIGVVPEGDFRPRHIRPKEQEVHPSSGYSLALAAGDYVFVAGRMADGAFGEGLAKSARLPKRHLWKGLPIKLEAEYIIREKIVPALAAAGSSLEHAIKCQVYLRDVDDFGPFIDVWSQFFPRGMPATTLIPSATPGFFLDDARIEINTLALKAGGATKREVIDAGVFPAYRAFPQAIRAGDLLLLSGMLAVDESGLVEAARLDPEQPYHGSSVQAQTDAMLDNAAKLCTAAGTSLENVVRIQHYLTDPADFNDVYQAWDRRLPGRHLPLSAVKVPFLPVPGCTVQLDLWVYAP
ncbi:MAG TPA: Rid family hydrolase [Burkholderiales bacterium]|nr:Rid family hydrolase [Burkholderiales bacterium]